MNKQILKARAGLVLDSPFFASLLLRFQCIEDSTCDTAWVDGRVIGYNNDYIDSLSLSETKGLLAHEVMHIALEHHIRRQERDPQRWNIATDYTINDILVDSGFQLPKGCLMGMGTDKSAEWIYNHLPTQNDKDGKRRWGQSNDPGRCGEVRDAKGADGKAVSPADQQHISAEVKVLVAQAAQAARSAGRMPAALDRLVKEILEPKVPWAEILSRFIQSSAKNDYVMIPPNRRYIHRGLYLPSLRSNELSEIVIVVDTSGSIGESEINQFAAEISSILQNFETTIAISVVYCDATIHGVQEFTSQDLPLTLKPIGGGGTDFRPPFEWVKHEGKAPACLIYLTDLCCNRLPDEPDYPVLWVTIGRECREMPFGEVINIK